MKNKEYLCICNKCGTILFDENPQTNAIKQVITGNEFHMKQIKDKETGKYFWACPVCETDANLMDL